MHTQQTKELLFYCSDPYALPADKAATYRLQARAPDLSAKYRETGKYNKEVKADNISVKYERQNAKAACHARLKLLEDLFLSYYGTYLQTDRNQN